VAVDDPLLPAAPHLTGPAARPLVDAAVRAGGGRLRRLRPRQVLYRPGRELVVRYDATVCWQRDHGGRGDPVEETILAGTTANGPPPGTLPLEADGMTVGVWRYPFDPFLPGLDLAVRAGPVASLLGADPDALELTVRTYRPTRRAVVHARWEGGESYLKVLPPDEAVVLAETHERLRESGVPLAAVTCSDLEAGVLALTPLGPEVLRTRVLEDRGPWPSGDDVVALLDRLASVASPATARPRSSPLSAAAGHARMLAAVLPSEAGRIEQLRERIGPAGRVGPITTMHGDLHDGQLIVDGSGRITGLLDVDGVGPGERIDDLANLVGHLSSLTRSSPGSTRSIETYAQSLRTSFARVVDQRELDRRVAAVVLALATGPFRVQARGWREDVRRRLALAERWVARSGERTLRSAS
jgi:Phosphotransferase enzyme family